MFVIIRDAFHFVQRKRFCISPNDGFTQQLMVCQFVSLNSIRDCCIIFTTPCLLRRQKCDDDADDDDDDDDDGDDIVDNCICDVYFMFSWMIFHHTLSRIPRVSLGIPVMIAGAVFCSGQIPFPMSIHEYQSTVSDVNKTKISRPDQAVQDQGHRI